MKNEQLNQKIKRSGNTWAGFEKVATRPNQHIEPAYLTPLNAMQRFAAIKKSGQWWKVLLAFWVVALGGLFMCTGIYEIRTSTGTGSLLLPLGSLIGFIGALFACVFVRCPKYKAAWVWVAISKKSPNEWFPWLMALEQCSECGGEGI